MFSKIVVGTDGSSTAGHAVDRAGQLAELCGGEVHLVYGCGGATLATEAVVGVPATITEATVEDFRADLETRAAPLREKGIDVSVHVVPVSGPEAVLNVADDVTADLIVVGSQGMTGKRRFILGSVPNAVSHHAACSVLIVHTS